MSKMSDMAMTIEELRSAAAAINEAANWLAEQFSGTAEEPPTKEPAAKREKKPELKLEDVRAVLAEKSRAGHTAAIYKMSRLNVQKILYKNVQLVCLS